MPSYAKILILCAGFAAAAPAGRPHTHGRRPWNPWYSWNPSGSPSGVSTTTPAAPTATIATATVAKEPTETVVSVPSSAPSTVEAPVAVTTTTKAAQAAAVTSSATSSGDVWQPTAGSSWQIVLSEKLDAAGTLTPDVAVFDIDMFSTDASTIQQLHDKGKRVVCYFSAGSYEPYRDDSDQFQSADLGSVMDGWPDEKWIDIRSSNVRSIMTKRIQLAAQKGCDAVDPDNVDGYGNENGLGLTEDDAYDYMKFLSTTAAANGLSTGLKNANALVPRVKDFIHFSVNEQCHEYNECGDFQAFIDQNKPVFNIEYPSEGQVVAASARTSACSATSAGDASGFSTVIKTLDLDGWVQFCDSSTATTATAN